MPGFFLSDGGRAAAGYKGLTGDCGIRALAIAAERPYQEVCDLLTELAARERITARRPKRSSVTNGIRVSTFHKMAATYGGRWIATMGIGTGCKVHLDAAELPAGRIVARVSRHYTAVIHGVICDNHDPRRYVLSWVDGEKSRPGRCVYGYWVFEGRR